MVIDCFVEPFFKLYNFNYFNLVKVCPHAGGVGLCEMVQHLQMWDYLVLSCTKENRMIEFVDQQHEQFINPAKINSKANYIAPNAAGYSTELKKEAIECYEYPNGLEWQKLRK